MLLTEVNETVIRESHSGLGNMRYTGVLLLQECGEIFEAALWKTSAELKS